MSNVLFAGDLHLGHRAICKYRPMFSSIEEHDAHLIAEIIAMGGKNNVLHLLGDIVFTKVHLETLRAIAAEFQKIVFVAGNHDMEREGRLIDLQVADNIELHAFKRYKEFWLSHPPIHPVELRGKVNIHGHVHNQTLDDPRYINTSVENLGFKPVSLDEIRDFRKKNPEKVFSRR